jgi:hypothetical protein
MATHTTDIWTDARARTVASWWHEFITAPCPLYKLQSTGYIYDATQPHIDALLSETDDPADEADLRALLAYVEHHGNREPVDGWSELWDDEYEDERGEQWMSENDD